MCQKTKESGIKKGRGKSVILSKERDDADMTTDRNFKQAIIGCFAKLHAQALVVLSVFLFAVTVSATASASGKYGKEPDISGFFETLYDVPIMTGLQELEDQALVFDKPSGRISHAAAIGQGMNISSIYLFYEDTLGQMGWTKIETQLQGNLGQTLTFVRGSDELRINTELDKEDPKTVVIRFYLTPR